MLLIVGSGMQKLKIGVHKHPKHDFIICKALQVLQYFLRVL